VDGFEFPRSQQAGEFTGVALVGLDAFTGLARDFGGGHHDTVVAELEEATNEHEAGRARLISDANFVLLDAELLAELHESALGAKRAPAPFAVVLGWRAVLAGSGDDDRVFVDVESDMEFDLHGVSWFGFLQTGVLAFCMLDRSRFGGIARDYTPKARHPSMQKTGFRHGSAAILSLQD